MLDYFSKSLILFKENPAIIILALIITALNIIVLQGIFNVLTPNMDISSPLGYVGIISFIILILVSIFIDTAIIGMIQKLLLNESVTLKTGWEIGVKYFLKMLILTAIIMVALLLLLLIIGIIVMALITLLKFNINEELLVMGILILSLFVLGFLTIFTPQAIVVGEKGVFASIKQSMQLAFNNKTTIIILLVALMLSNAIGFIPSIGSMLSSIIGPVLSIYITILITLVYIDLT